MTVAERPAAEAGADLAAALTPLAARAAGLDVPTLVSAAVPVEAVDAIALHGVSRPLGATLWTQPSEGVALVGIGEAWAARQSHQGRFQIVSVAWRMLLEGALIDTGGSAVGGPRALGGFSFDDAPSSSAIWDGFEAACLLLPALLLTTTPAGSWLTASMVVEPEGIPPGTMIGSLHETWAHLATTPVHPSGPARQSLRIARRQPESAAWQDSVARLAGAVGRGRLDKAVLSREVSLQAASDIDITGVLRRLEVSAPESTIFAVSRGPRTFLGATPERLVSLHGRELRTMAMAGSARRDATPEVDDALAAELLASDKEREEHAVVVAMLREALTPVSAELSIPSAPTVVRLRHVQHLVTPVSGRLRDEADVLTLVERLHPTPAVGGTPRELALELIAEEEPHERGWYAGPLGWVDRQGDGEFVVALRCGVVSGSEATLFAGCGIVADSDPQREWQESSTKLEALGSALGHITP
jgi:salicylate biosynthesis isochorismate synthase